MIHVMRDRIPWTSPVTWRGWWTYLTAKGRCEPMNRYNVLCDRDMPKGYDRDSQDWGKPLLDYVQVGTCSRFDSDVIGVARRVK